MEKIEREALLKLIMDNLESLDCKALEFFANGLLEEYVVYEGDDMFLIGDKDES